MLSIKALRLTHLRPSGRTPTEIFCPWHNPQDIKLCFDVLPRDCDVNNLHPSPSYIRHERERERARRESVRGVSQVQADDELRVDLVWDAESGVTGTALLVVAFLSLFGVVVIAAEETVS
jgi:hypothetical protein